MRIRFGLALVAIAFIALVSGPALAATIYNVNIVSGGTRAKGSITTDSTLGVLEERNILDWDLRVETGGEFALLDGSSNSQRLLLGTVLTATASGLFFDFGSVDGGLLVFQGPVLGSGMNALCFSAATYNCYEDFARVVVATENFIEVFTIGGGNEQIASIDTVPLPAALPLFASALGGLGFAAWRRRSAGAANRPQERSARAAVESIG